MNRPRSNPRPGALWIHSHGLEIIQETLIFMRPQTAAFRPWHLLIPDDTARGVVIRDIKIGNCSQLSYQEVMTDKGVPASRFAIRAERSSLFVLRREHGPHEIDVDLYKSLISETSPVIGFSTIQCAQDLCFTVAPIAPSDHVPRVFEAFLLGDMAR